MVRKNQKLFNNITCINSTVNRQTQQRQRQGWQENQYKTNVGNKSRCQRLSYYIHLGDTFSYKLQLHQILLKVKPQKIFYRWFLLWNLFLNQLLTHICLL